MERWAAGIMDSKPASLCQRTPRFRAVCRFLGPRVDPGGDRSIQRRFLLVVQRTNEFGIRMALGAQRWDVLKIVFASAGISVGLGIVAGLGLSFALNRLIAQWVENARRARSYCWRLAFCYLAWAARPASCRPDEPRQSIQCTHCDVMIALKPRYCAVLDLSSDGHPLRSALREERPWTFVGAFVNLIGRG